MFVLDQVRELLLKVVEELIFVLVEILLEFGQSHIQIQAFAPRHALHRRCVSKLVLQTAFLKVFFISHFILHADHHQFLEVNLLVAVHVAFVLQWFVTLILTHTRLRDCCVSTLRIYVCVCVCIAVLLVDQLLLLQQVLLQLFLVVIRVAGIVIVVQIDHIFRDHFGFFGGINNFFVSFGSVITFPAVWVGHADIGCRIAGYIVRVGITAGMLVFTALGPVARGALERDVPCEVLPARDHDVVVVILWVLALQERVQRLGRLAVVTFRHVGHVGFGVGGDVSRVVVMVGYFLDILVLDSFDVSHEGRVLFGSSIMRVRVVLLLLAFLAVEFDLDIIHVIILICG